MQPNLKKNERELIKLTRFFRKRAEAFAGEGKLTEEQKANLINSCESLEKSLSVHASYRDGVLQRRETLEKSIKDNAECPKCHGRTQLKHLGVSVHESGWKSNKYKCRKCNIEFVWNRPNNPWDMAPFIENLISDLEQKMAGEDMPEAARQEYTAAIQQMQANLEQMRPVLKASDEEFEELSQRDKEMAKTVHDFTNFLMIEKIRMNVWNEEKQG